MAGYNELIDMSTVEKIDFTGPAHLRQLAALSAAMDVAAPPSKFAIVAPDHLSFGLGRMYEAYRGLEERSTKEVGVFRTLEQAFTFLGIAATPGK